MILSNRYFIVNYHYVHELGHRTELGGVFPCSPSEFEKHVQYLTHHTSVVTADEVYEAAQEGREGRFSAITFDDGLKDHYEIAAPILEKYGAKGTFFIITGSLRGSVPIAHKIHRIRSQYSIPKLITAYRSFMNEVHPEVLEAYPIPEGRLVDENERYDDTMTSNFKTTIARINPEIANDFLCHVLKRMEMDEREIARGLFLDEPEIRELAERGMQIGAHGVSHDPLSTLPDDAAREEIVQSRDTLERVTGRRPFVFAYSHGACRDSHLGFLKEAGFTHGFSLGNRGIAVSDNPLMIPRYDANDLRDALKQST